MSEKCSQNKYCELFKTGCHLRDTLQTQAETGAHTSSECTTNGAGPYWEKPEWDDLVKRTADMATQDCAQRETVLEEIRTLTEEKTRKGEIVDST
jgi:hypothetical protein